MPLFHIFHSEQDFSRDAKPFQCKVRLAPTVRGAARQSLRSPRARVHAHPRPPTHARGGLSRGLIAVHMCTQVPAGVSPQSIIGKLQRLPGFSGTTALAHKGADGHWCAPRRVAPPSRAA